jgi:hypothetical protein
MQTFITLLILLIFSSVVVSAGLQVLNVAKFIADMYQKLPNSCIFITNSDAQHQGENNFDLISHEL